MVSDTKYPNEGADSQESAEAGSGRESPQKYEDVRLKEMGYRPELDRKFSLLSCLAVGFSASFPYRLELIFNEY